MREIKFRSWDKQQKVMFEIFDSTSQTEWFLPNLHERHEIMQFSGIKDSKDAEVWEGDLLKISIYNRLNYSTERLIVEKVLPVEYRGCKFGVDWPDGFTGLDEFSMSVTTFEVVGSIYDQEQSSNP